MIRTKCFLCLTLIFAVRLLAQPPSQRWLPAKHHGLTIGVSSRADVLKVLGKPDFSGPEEGTGISIVSYQVADPFRGHLMVFFRKGILSSLRLDLDKSVAKSEIIRVFGPNFIVKHFDVDDCRESGGVAPLYESKSGLIEHMECRELGVSVNLVDAGFADAVSYDYRSRISAHSLCNNAKSALKGKL